MAASALMDGKDDGVRRSPVEGRAQDADLSGPDPGHVTEHDQDARSLVPDPGDARGDRSAHAVDVILVDDAADGQSVKGGADRLRLMAEDDDDLVLGQKGGHEVFRHPAQHGAAVDQMEKLVAAKAARKARRQQDRGDGA